MNENHEMPNGWACATIPEIIPSEGVFVDGDWIESKDQDPNGEVRLIQLADIGDGGFRDKSSRFLTLKRANELNCTFLRLDDILVARMPDPIGRACLFPLKKRNSFITAVDVAIIRLGEKSVVPKYLMYSINSLYIRREIESLQSGTTRKRISRSNLAIIKFPIPSLPEQQRIVAKIEELFSSLDKGIENLKTAQQQLKVYRQAVLKWAFEGKLTKEWRSLNNNIKFDFEINKILQERINAFEAKIAEAKKNKTPKPRTPKNLDKKYKINQECLRFLGDVPKEWVALHIAAISDNLPDSIVDGPFGSSINVANDYIENGVPVIRINNILPFYFEINKLKYIREEKFSELKRHNVLPGDVLFGKVGTIGNSCIYPIGKPEAMLSTTGSCRIRVDYKMITNKYVCYYLNSQRNNFNEIASAAVQAFLNMETINNFPIPVCSLKEQYLIVDEIESRLSVCDKIEEAIEQSLRESEALRQSILKKAFEGKLVLQDPNDEQASVLLARIKAAREKNKLEKTLRPLARKTKMKKAKS